MFTIKRRQTYWEAWVNGDLVHWDEDIEAVLDYLRENIDDIMEEYFES